MRVPGSLLQKLIHDCERMKADPLSTYAAFDFFVTADHMLDWEFPNSIPGARETKIELRRANQLLAICSHLGNGAKHFELSNPRHNSVQASELHQGAFHPAVFSSAFNVSHLVVWFSDEQAQSYGPTMEAIQLASLAVKLWEERLNIHAEAHSNDGMPLPSQCPGAQHP